METPILFLVFNRPSLTQRVFDEIRKAKPKRLFVAIDGPRKDNNADLENIKKVLDIITDLDWDCKLELLEREKNLGCGLAVSSAIDWFFSKVEEGIILEDDCVPSIDFFTFTESMLEKHRNNKAIMSINGSNPFPFDSSVYSYSFTSYNLIWGWATWKDRWGKYKYDLSQEGDFKIIYLLFLKFKFDLISVRSWYKHLKLVINKKINTWDYQWIYTCLIYNGLVVTPAHNLINNIGNDFEPTHGVINSFYIDFPVDTRTLFPIRHPDSIKINRKLEKQIKIKRFGNSLILFIKSKIQKIKNNIKNNKNGISN
jgi:hypothetical protein